ncbi:hypothetical protein FE257_011530 [Aspergillus nanangensis]|uniref:Asparaginase family protein n=1 Tax=Aspergillus nanangensis TaxID=2582783 RepID=A0AAD4CH47_ASPNN|nr:hypothetical protein FE257_011530 [Aspergillus nanangensis]
MNHPADISAIFVHAGAGFHSHSNERAHLETCEKAARVAMAILKSGGSALDAVEIAIMILEDAEITNAGYGSNMTLDGSVECDATIVNHLGRGGAVGAVAQVKNPISLARVILDDSTKQLSLQRVPPNFLVGQGATEYAYDQGLVTLPPDALISTAARERWRRWRQDLEAAEFKERQQDPAKYQEGQYKAHIRRPIVNQAQLLTSPSTTVIASALASPLPDTIADNLEHFSDQPHGIKSPSLTSPIRLEPMTPRVTKTRDGASIDDSPVSSGRSATVCSLEPPAKRHRRSRSLEVHPSSTSKFDTASDVTNLASNKSALLIGDEHGHNKPDPADVDQISDTVGAIAIDIQGNIAAGSSSGGIGMKHRGRIGPAALVGIGTMVIPVDPNDSEQTCVAAVTSGTGEHIATTFAASTCASRVYYCQQKCEDGTFEEVTEEEALRAMIASEFMGHPGVKNSHCQGAIGIMTVKKTVDGVFLYFGHNTDSFALASMSSEDTKPVSVMSRSNGNGSIAQGGRACRRKRQRTPNSIA